jgi:HlyD family type I secretion membrane fusion protein
MLGWLREVFVPTAEVDAETDMRRIVRAGLVVAGTGAVALGAWASLAPLAGAVIAPGFVKVDMNRKVVQHQEGGIVRELKVRDGDRVARGQPLLVLEDLRVDAAVELLRQQLDAERAKAARLDSERGLAPKVAFPADLERRRGEAKLAEQLEREAALFRARRDALESQIAVLRKQIGETHEEARALGDQIVAGEKAIRLQKEELALNEKLLKENFVQKTRLMTLERAVAEYEARLGEHRAELAKARQRASELELRILALRNGYVQAATDELKEATARVFDLQERMRPSQDAAERQVIRAPAAGEVVGLRVFSAGAVVAPRDVLLEVVPEEKSLVIEARIRPEDINYVKPGSVADVRLTAYKQRTTPLVEGTVIYVSADRLVEAAAPGAPAQAYYAAHIDVPAAALAAAGNLRMQAGMPAEVFIRTDRRSALDYMLAPVTAYLRRGMREPL